MSKVTAKDVLEFFKNAELEIAELVHEVGGQAVASRQATKAKMVAGLAKARAARKPKAAVQATPVAQEGQATSAAPVRRGPGRPPTVHAPAPAHTAAATAVESDEILA